MGGLARLTLLFPWPGFTVTLIADGMKPRPWLGERRSTAAVACIVGATLGVPERLVMTLE